MTLPENWDVVVAGAGVGGVSAAVNAARQGARTLLIERMTDIGGTGVHSNVALISRYWDAKGRVINDGFHRELFPSTIPCDHKIRTYDPQELAERYHALTEAEPTLTVYTGTSVEKVHREDGTVVSAQLTGNRAGDITSKVWIDSTADGIFSSLAGCAFEVGREGDHAMQPSTLTFTVDGIDFDKLPRGNIAGNDALSALWEELTPLFLKWKRTGKLNNPRENVLCFPYPDNRRLLFNQTRITGVDPTDPDSLARARKEGERQIREFMPCLKEHPAFRNAFVESVSPMLGVREGRRILGDHVLNEAECLGEARFDDMIAACGSSIDIHNPVGTGTVMKHIPGSGYFHIPYRAIIPRDTDNLLLSSRCLSGTHEAHSAYRVMCVISCVGQAAGIAAGLAARLADGRVREVDAAWIRFELHRAGAFTEGERTPPPSPTS
ncbi:MAG: FAD-dependent oxidoreductase [Kiritimatiellae bacterium]|jgi:hypothetical protein|nr:FAD-dependent oxidoreductase [Kiritimatiellia bacterium]